MSGHDALPAVAMGNGEMRLVRGEWRWFGAGNEHIESPTEYLPLPVLP